MSLKDELDAIKDFVDLENIRFAEKCKIELKSISDTELSVSPLIVFSYLEYNFKPYSLNDIPFQSCKIDMKQKGKKLIVQILNSNFVMKKNSDSCIYEIEKMRRQLEISYPQKYNIEEKKTSHKYSIKLEIDL